jgi:hypothetical protein
LEECVKNFITLFQILAVLAALGAAPSSALGGIIWSESVNGGLSNNPSQPTVLTVSPGSNRVIGSTDPGSPVSNNPNLFTHADFFSFTVPNGYQLTAVNVLVGDDQSLAFAAVGSGGQITFVNTFPTNLLGSALFIGAGYDLLPLLGTDADTGVGTGFTPPLGPGTYTWWLQEDSAGSTLSYDLSFEVSAVPEPSSLLLLGMSFAAAGWYGWHRKRRG